MKKFTGILIIILFLFLAGSFCKADSIDELQNKIDIANKNREELEKEIANYQAQLKTIGEQTATLQNTIKSLDLSVSKINAEVKLVENNISKATYTIRSTSREIENKKGQINQGNQAIEEALKEISEADNYSLLEILLSNQETGEFWNDIEEIIQVQSKVSDRVKDVKNIKTSLEKAKIKLEQEKVELEKYNRELDEEKQVLQSTKKEKNDLLAVTKNTEANYQKVLQNKLALKEALDQEISTFEAQLKLAIDPGSYPKAKKGIISWPLSSIYITQYFGKTADSRRLYTSGTHNGVDFRAAIGTQVKSASDGVIDDIGNTDVVCSGASYGKWVLIRYDNGLASVYAHLSLITVKAGQRVKTGTVVGYSGNTGYSTGPHLHMSLFASQGVKVSTLKSTVCRGTYVMPLADPKAYLDPIAYLPAL